MRRRMVTAGMTAILAGCGHGASAQDAEVIRLWPGQPPGPGAGPGGSGLLATQSRHGVVVTDVATPSLQVVRPARPNGAAMLVATGGGLRRIETGKEALPAAGFLASQGITAYVLRYRLPGEGWSPLAPFQDVHRAMRLIRVQPGIDARRVGVLGFSAGANLVGLVAAEPGRVLYPPMDAANARTARAALAGLVYPVISLLPPNDNTQAQRQLAGSDPGRASAFSAERHVTSAMSPVFLVQAMDDPVAPVANTRLMETACRAAGVPVEAHLFRTGGYGWGMGQGETAQWPRLFMAWLSGYGFQG